jgi:hypothetical protein
LHGTLQKPFCLPALLSGLLFIFTAYVQASGSSALINLQLKVSSSYALHESNMYCGTNKSAQVLTSPFTKLQTVYSYDQLLRDILMSTPNKSAWLVLVRKFEGREYQILKHMVSTGQADIYVKKSRSAAYQLFIIGLHVVASHKELLGNLKHVFNTSKNMKYSMFVPILESRVHGIGVASGATSVTLPVKRDPSCFNKAYVYFRARYNSANPLFISYIRNTIDNI